MQNYMNQKTDLKKCIVLAKEGIRQHNEGQTLV